MGKHYYGNSHPVNVFRNGVKLAGYTKQQQSGNALTFADTYNDAADITVSGNTVQQSDYYNKTGLSSQAGTPTPDVPIAITSNLPANTYKVSDGTDWYEFTLADDLRGIGTALDSVEFDRVSKTGYLRKKCGKVVLNGGEAGWYVATTYVPTDTSLIRFGMALSAACANSTVVCDRFVNSHDLAKEEIWAHSVAQIINVVVAKSRLSTLDAAGFKSWLSTNPVTVVYQLATPTRTPLTFTKNNASTATEVPMTFLTSTPALEYPATVYDSAGTLTVSDNANQSQQFTLPTLRKIGSIADEYDLGTGVVTRNIGVQSCSAGSSYAITGAVANSVVLTKYGSYTLVGTTLTLTATESFDVIYQLATPVIENLGANVVPTYYPTTLVDTVQNNVAVSTIDVEAKVMDI